ncbi:MAG TPA: hypothetical protein VN894_06375 [Polyangiaceae bacterium]|nr:hypothetical protein [Polyangiaceae bacterium]
MPVPVGPAPLGEVPLEDEPEGPEQGFDVPELDPDDPGRVFAPEEPEPDELAPEEPELDDAERESDPDDPEPDDPEPDDAELPPEELELAPKPLVPEELAPGAAAFPVADPDGLGLERPLLASVAEPPGWVLIGALAWLPHAEGVTTMGKAQSASPIL